jgi:mono/diheme cytochrome c family protein
MINNPIRSIVIRIGIGCAIGFGYFIIAISARSASEGNDLLSQGKELYAISCSPCHGISGHGDGPLAYNLKIFPRDFTKGVYKSRSTASGQLPTDYDLFHTVTAGIHSQMPGFRGQTLLARWAVVQYIKTLCDRFSDLSEYPLDTLAFGRQIVSSPKSLSRGRMVYLQMRCAECHGSYGRGDGKAAYTQNDDFGNPLHVTDLTNYSDYKFSRNILDVYRIFSTGMNGVPMPSYNDNLSEDDRWNLANYVWALQNTDQYPSMATEAEK